MVAISLLYRRGYFSKHLSEDGSQTEAPVIWRVEDFLKEEAARVTVPFENRRVELALHGAMTSRACVGSSCRSIFWMPTLESNAEQDRDSDRLAIRRRFLLSSVSGSFARVGGVRMLRALGYTDLTRYHMNEGHAAMLTLELLGEEAEKSGRTSIRGEDIEKVRSKCIFTTHTPVPAGHDRFPMEYLTRAFPDQNGFFDLKDASSADLVKKILQAEQNYPDLQEAARAGASLNMTYLALSLSTYVNGVAKLHGETSRKMFPAGAHRSDYQRSARGHMDFCRVRGIIRPLHFIMARRQLSVAERAGHAAGGSVGFASDCKA